MSSTNPNYTDPRESSVGAQAERVGDITGEPPTNKATDKDKASKMANLLEGLDFPATKEEIRAHVNSRSPAAGNRINDVLEVIQNNLDDGRQYASAYEVEVAAGLVKRADKPYEQASGGPASARNVSSNTPKGEDL